MKVGDLVRVKQCDTDIGIGIHFPCQCFFCSSGSNRVGSVIAVAPRDSFHVMFDTGMWRLDSSDVDRGDVEVISESR